MLSERDHELAREIGRQVRQAPVHANPFGPLPGPIAWIASGITGSIAYWLRNDHSLFWGTALFISACFLVCHAIYRESEFFGNRAVDLFFLVLYSTVFWLALSELWARDYLILTGMIGLAAFVTITALISSIFKKQIRLH
jgi:hypothetical protein